MYEKLSFINCGGTYCYVIQGYQGDVLIDTGEKRYRNEIEMWLLNFNIKIIILTHGHNDCIENAAYFSKLYNAEVYMTEADYELAKNNMSRSFYACGLSGQLISSAAFKIMKRQAEEFKVNFIHDGHILATKYGIPCYIIDLEGHTKGSIGVYYAEDLYVGDAVMNVVYPSFPYICESPKAARRSIERFKNINPKRLLFTHGEPIETKHNKAYLNLFSKHVIM